MKQSHFTDWVKGQLPSEEYVFFMRYLEPNGHSFRLIRVEELRRQGITVQKAQVFIERMRALGTFYDQEQEREEFGDMSVFS